MADWSAVRRALPLLAISLLGVLGWILLRSAPRDAAPPLEPASTSSSAARAPLATAPSPGEPLPSTAARAPERTPSARVDADPAAPRLEVLVLDGAGGPPGVELELRLSDALDQALLETPAPIGRDGRARVAWPAPTRHAAVWGRALDVLPPTTLDSGMSPLPLTALHGEAFEEEQHGPIELRMDRERWVVRATVRDPEGRPLRAARLRVRPSRLGPQPPLVVTTGPAGELALALWFKSGHLGDLASLELLRLFDDDEDAREERALAQLDLFKAPTRGRLALNVTLEAHDRLVAGRFEDPDGSPETGRLTLEQLVAGDRWEPLACELEIEGSRFEARGARPAGALRLVPFFGGHARPPVEFEAGVDDLVVVLESFGELRGRALLDPGVTTQQLELVLRRRGARETIRRADWVTGTGFAATELEPGSWDLEVSACGQPFARVEAISVSSALPSRDPRLDPLDLRGRLRSLELKVETDLGSYPRGARVLSLDESGRKHELGRAPVLRLWHAAPLDLLVSAEGRREQLLRGVDQDRTVRLAPGLELELTIEGLPTLHARPAWSIALWPADQRAGARNQNRVDAPLDEHGGARLGVDAPGSWEVELRYLRRGQWTAFAEGASIGRIEVRDTAERQPFQLTVPADFLARAGR